MKSRLILIMTLLTLAGCYPAGEQEIAPLPDELLNCAVDEQIASTQPLQEPITEVFELPTPKAVSIVPELDEQEVILLSKLVYGEAGICSKTEQAAVVWCVLNRVDSKISYFPNTITEVVLQENQFHGYNKNNPVKEDIVELVKDVLIRWKSGSQEGRVLPEEYFFFHGDGIQNYFRTNYKHNGIYWNWRLESPYEAEA